MKKLLILILLLMIYSCSRDNEEKQTVSLLHYFTGNLSSGIDNLSNVVDAKSKNINLVATPLDHEEFKVSIRIQLEGDNPPDLFTYWAGARTKYLVETKKIQPITDLFNSRIDKNIFDESVFNACSYNGEIYLMPITRHFVGFFYNKKIFNQLGITPPTTWEELIEVASEIRNSEITPFALGAKNRWPAQFWFDYILLRTAGFDYRKSLMDNKSSYNELEVKNAVKLWKELIDNNYFGNNILTDDWDIAAKEVISKRSAMTLMGTWVIPLLETNGLKPDIDYGFFPFPSINENNELVSLGPIDGILLSKGSKSSSGSMDVLYQLSTPETQDSFNSLSGAITPHLKADTKIYNSVQLEIKDIISKSSHWAFNYDLATSPVISEAGLNFFVDFLKSPEDYEKLLEDLVIYVEENKN